MPRPRFRFRSEHAGLTIDGLGWHAQFRDGRFETDNEHTAIGVLTRARQHPEYGIAIVRGSDKPEPAEAPAPPAPAEG
jgi:hypothetical protein